MWYEKNPPAMIKTHNSEHWKRYIKIRLPPYSLSLLTIFFCSADRALSFLQVIGPQFQYETNPSFSVVSVPKLALLGLWLAQFCWRMSQTNQLWPRGTGCATNRMTALETL